MLRISAILLLTVKGFACSVTTGQLHVAAHFGSVRVENHGHALAMNVDLNESEEYRENRSRVTGLREAAMLGEIENLDSLDVEIDVWMLADTASSTTPSEVMEAGNRIWGPVSVEAGRILRLDRDTSSELFLSEGEEQIVDEARGDGRFSLYFIARRADHSSHSFVIEDSSLELVLITKR